MSHIKYYNEEDLQQKTPTEWVKDFHRSFGQAVNAPAEKDLVNLRKNLIEEEFNEVVAELNALKQGPDYQAEVRLLKELCDLLYVVYGTAVAFGFDIDGAFEEVHKSNMSKLGLDGKPVLREDGKALKGPNYFKANVSRFV